MNIQSAAEFLNISVRAVERLVKAKKIAVTYIEGKRNFSEVELTRFKEHKQEPVYRPAIAATQNDTALSQVVAPEYLSESLEYMET
ncbi:helix-turn-helix domain-containing protein [Nostoc sp.]